MEQKRREYIELLKSGIPTAPARDAIYDFCVAHDRYMEINHSYSVGGIASAEAHTLKHICQNPGVTVTDIVNYWGRTKGTVSAQVTKLEEKGLIRKEKCKQNSRVTHIFPTEAGIEVNNNHTAFDIEESTHFFDEWIKKYTIDDLYSFLEQLDFYAQFMIKRTKEQSV